MTEASSKRVLENENAGVEKLLCCFFCSALQFKWRQVAVKLPATQFCERINLSCVLLKKKYGTLLRKISAPQRLSGGSLERSGMSLLTSQLNY